MREHANIPSPDDYHSVRTFLESNPEIVELGIDLLMQMAGSTCPISTRQAVSDHLTVEVDNMADDLHPDSDQAGNISVSISETRLRSVIRYVLSAAL